MILNSILNMSIGDRIQVLIDLAFHKHNKNKFTNTQVQTNIYLLDKIHLC